MDDQPGTQAAKPLRCTPLMSATARAAADRGEVALVAVVERRRSRRPRSRARIGAGGVAALLHRDRCHAGERHDRPVAVAHRDHVAEREHLGVARQRQVGPDGDPPGPVDLRSGQPRQRGRRAFDAVTPAAQIDGARGDALGRRCRRLDGHRLGVDIDDRVATERGDAEPLERALSACSDSDRRERRRARGRRPRPAGCAPSRGSTVRKSRRRVSRASSAIWPAISTPVGPAPTTTNVSQARRAVGVGLDLGGLEGGEDLAPDLERALERLELGRVLGATRRARSRSTASRPRRSACRTRAPRPRRPFASRRADAPARSRSMSATSASTTRTLRWRLKIAPQWIRDLAGRERAGRDLIGQRLEQVEVPPVDQRHVDRRPAKLLDGLEPAEAAADDDDARARAVGAHLHFGRFDHGHFLPGLPR